MAPTDRVAGRRVVARPATDSNRRDADGDGDQESRNEVLLVGRLSARPAERTLPSGDLVATFRVVVPRTGASRPGAPSGRVTIDAVECTAWLPRLRRVVMAWGEGDVVEVRGALRRRFWKTQGGVASATEVEAASARRVKRAA